MKSHRPSLAVLLTAAVFMSLSPHAVALAEDPLLKQVDRAIEVSKLRYLTAGLHTPWQILHGVLAFRGDYQLKDQSGRLINAVDWISQNQTFNGKRWFQKTRYGGRAQPYTKDYIFEGHPNQFLAMMALAGYPLDHKLTTGDSPITVRDLVENAKKEVNSRDEPTWTLWSLSHYLGPDATWTNKYREAWSIERLVSLQTRAPTGNAACGGTHGLFAVAIALNTYKKTNRPLRGVWMQAEQRIRRYTAIARSTQNFDGSFSSQYFRSRGYSRKFARRLNTSGHVLEFLMLSLPKKRLNEAWVRKAVASVANDLIANRHVPAEPGALYHALDGLILYRQRMTGKGPRLVSERKRAPVVARRPRPLRSAKTSKVRQTGAKSKSPEKP